MLKNLRMIWLKSVAFVVTLIAFSGASTNSMWMIYEPEIPKCIKEDL